MSTKCRYHDVLWLECGEIEFENRKRWCGAPTGSEAEERMQAAQVALEEMAEENWKNSEKVTGMKREIGARWQIRRRMQVAECKIAEWQNCQKGRGFEVYESNGDDSVMS